MNRRRDLSSTRVQRRRRRRRVLVLTLALVGLLLLGSGLFLGQRAAYSGLGIDPAEHRALSLAYSASFFGGVFSVICLILLSPVLVRTWRDFNRKV